MTASFDIGVITLDWLRDTHPDIDARLEDHDLRLAIGAVTQASRFLTRLLISEPEALSIVEHHGVRPDFTCETEAALARWKRLELLRIATRDVIGVDAMDDVGRHLARLADDVIIGAARLAGADDLVIVGMGKLGGNELNYSSDIDMLFVGDADPPVIREVMRIARQSFRVDAALRPEGRVGALTRTVASYRKYWEESASAWEFQALMKSRVICGPDEIGIEWAEAARHAVWDKPFGPEEIREARHMKAMAEELVKQAGNTDREVKRGRGGIRDIEFAVQLLQLVHGAGDETVRSATTLTALDELAAGGYIATDDAISLGESYRFLRTVEHRLQLVDEQQTHLLPEDRQSRQQLAGALGYRGHHALAEFETDLGSHRSRVRNAHERLYFRPLLEAFAHGRIDPKNPLVTQLAAFGFTDAERTRVAVGELTRGLARSSHLMQQMMPLLLDWLSDAPDPDEGLLGLRTMISGFRTPVTVINAFRDSPESARRLCLLLGTGRMFSREFRRRPDSIRDLSNDRAMNPPEHVEGRLRSALQWRKDDLEQREALARLIRMEKLRIASSDVLGLVDSAETNRLRTDLAVTALRLSYEALQPDVPIALIGMGRLGGGEMGYGSDLDVVVVHGGTTTDDQRETEVFAQRLLGVVSDPNPGRNLYTLDYNLRPEGRNGVLARSIESCREYYEHWAQTWERQALVRAHPIAGDPTVLSAFFSLVDEFVWDRSLDSEAIRDIRMLKARMERERIPRREDPTYHLKLGPGSLSDVEWTVQMLQLRHSIPGTNTLDSLQMLSTRNVLDDDDSRTLREAWTFCDETRNRLFLIGDGPTNSLPNASPGLTALARSLQHRDIREIYKKLTRRSRSVVERLFYGQNP